MTVWTNGNWDNTKPATSRSPKFGAADMVEFKKQTEDRLTDMIYGFKGSEQDSDLIGFKKAIFRPQSTPDTESNAILLYGKNIGGKCRLHTKNSDGAEEVLIPAGLIVMWAGLLANIPDGWNLCNGENGTPDLLDKFIKCVATATEPGGTGGASTHTHTGPAHTHTITHTHSLPAHVHNLEPSESYTQRYSVTQDIGRSNVVSYFMGTMLYTGDINHRFYSLKYSTIPSEGSGTSGSSSAGTTGSGGTGATGSGSSLPPYYALAFIQKS